MAVPSIVKHSDTVASEKAGTSISEKEVTLDEKTAGLDTPRYLVASPYTEQEHLLDLETLDVENQILAQALVEMRHLREDYATASYLESFNWEEVIERARLLATVRGVEFKETSWYIVAFRSRIKPTTEYPDLGVLDQASHAEAMASGGFLK